MEVRGSDAQPAHGLGSTVGGPTGMSCVVSVILVVGNRDEAKLGECRVMFCDTVGEIISLGNSHKTHELYNVFPLI